MAEYHYKCEKCKIVFEFRNHREAPFIESHFVPNSNKECDGEFYRLYKPTTVIIKDYKKESIYKK